VLPADDLSGISAVCPTKPGCHLRNRPGERRGFFRKDVEAVAFPLDPFALEPALGDLQVALAPGGRFQVEEVGPAPGPDLRTVLSKLDFVQKPFSRVRLARLMDQFVKFAPSFSNIWRRQS
jgi:hypothetical protein